MLAAIPVKPFGVAKARLSGVLDARTRARLGKAMARRTAEAAAAAGAEPGIVTADTGVAQWARRLGLAVAPEQGDGLDGAAAGGVAAANDASWLVLHADLPLVAAADLRAAIDAVPDGGTMLAPATDGGTNAIAGNGPFPFRYGPGSFHRHLRRATLLGPVTVVARPGLAVDVDSPGDLAAAASHPGGAWLAAHLA